MTDRQQMSQKETGPALAISQSIENNQAIAKYTDRLFVFASAMKTLGFPCGEELDDIARDIVKRGASVSGALHYAHSEVSDD